MSSSVSGASPTDSERNPPAEVSALLATAQRFETPCGDGSIVWHSWGEPSPSNGSPPLVMFHGGAGSWTHWLRNIPALAAAGRQVFVPDLPGFGDSATPPQGNDADVLPEPLELGLKQLIGERACDLVGFSFGGLTAGFFVTAFPQRVARLILVGAPGMDASAVRNVHLTSWRHVEDAAEREKIHRSNLAALMLHDKSLIDDLVLRLHIDNVTRDRLPGRKLARTDALARMLTKMRCPVFAIYGREDVLYRNNLQVLEAALWKAPDFRGLTLIENAGHWVQFERAEAFNAALLAALATKP